jgi:signal transduction histidine kinase
VKQDLAALTVATHVSLAVVIIALFLLYERSLARSRNAQLKDALRVLARGSREPLPADDPLAAPFTDAASVVEARMEEVERVIREKTCQEAAVVKAQCEELVEDCSQRLHQEKRDTLTALDALRAEHILEAKAWTAGLERERDARKDAEERRRALEERLAKVDQEIADRNSEHDKLTGEVSRLSVEVERLRTQNLKFFDKVAAQLRGSLHIALKLAAELAEAGDEKGGKKSDGVPARFVEERAGEIQKRIARLERLIDQIVDLCRVETSTLTLVYSEVDVLSVIKRCLGDLREAAAEKHVNLTFKSPKAMPEIITDTRLLTRMLRELLSNAVRFTRRGGRVSVMANVADVNPLGQPVKDASVEWLRVDVTDTGEGIPAADQERIFTAFERGGEQFGTSDANPGLGLTLTRHYVKLLGGDLLLQSEAGHGSTFSVVLPVKVCVTTQVQ